MNVAKAPPTVPILIVLAYWEGDRAQAREVAALMADLQPHHVGKAAHVLVVCRQDSEIDEKIMESLAVKFNVSSRVATSPLRGWPGGCNGMFGTSMQFLTYAIPASIPSIDCVFWMEADCVPMATNWFSDLAKVWTARRKGANIVGAMSDCNGNGTGMHVTGCALYHPMIARILPEITTCDGVAWDYGCRAKMVPMAENTDSIALHFRKTGAHYSLLRGHHAVIHGYKDDSLIRLVRQHRVSPLK